MDALLFVDTTHRILIIIWFALQVGAFKIFVSPSRTGPLDLTLATHDVCFVDKNVTDGATAWAELAREARWVDIYLPLNRCS